MKCIKLKNLNNNKNDSFTKKKKKKIVTNRLSDSYTIQMGF